MHGADTKKDCLRHRGVGNLLSGADYLNIARKVRFELLANAHSLCILAVVRHYTDIYIIFL